MKVLHWDGKLLSDTVEATGEQVKHENLAVLVTCPPGYEEGKLLGIPKTPNGTDAATKDAVCTLLTDWNINDDILALVFDTTASNSGKDKGASVLIEKELNYKVGYFGCRHHVAELMASATWKELFGESKSPDNPLFKNFKQILIH